MKATELRIGNYHESNSIDIPREGIRSIRINGKAFSSISGYGIYLAEQGKLKVKPIPLTEEWLLKLGLVFIENIQELKHYWIDDTGLFSIRESKYNKRAYDLIVHVRADETVFIMSFDYVHEIQNYFGLTGKELTIKN